MGITNKNMEQKIIFRKFYIKEYNFTIKAETEEEAVKIFERDKENLIKEKNSKWIMNGENLWVNGIAVVDVEEYEIENSKNTEN
jgi:hypothetical protein